MAAARPPYHEPPPDTIDDAELIIDQTAPPQKSPIQRPLPFAGPGRPPAPAPPRPAPPRPPPPRAPSTPYGDETAAPQRSPLAEALPFRHAKPAGPEPTMALPMMTPEVLARLTGGAPAPAGPPGGAPDRAKLDRARLEQARTVAFAMPPGFEPAATPPVAQAPGPPANTPRAPLSAPPGTSPVPAAGGPVAAKSTGHFGLSIEQYAALCAEIGVFPERGEAIFAQYGLAVQKDRITADLAWQDRLRADNALMARWQSLYLYYHEHYSRLKQR